MSKSKNQLNNELIHDSIMYNVQVRDVGWLKYVTESRESGLRELHKNFNVLEFSRAEHMFILKTSSANSENNLC